MLIRKLVSLVLTIAAASGYFAESSLAQGPLTRAGRGVVNGLKQLDPTTNSPLEIAQGVVSVPVATTIVPLVVTGQVIGNVGQGRNPDAPIHEPTSEVSNVGRGSFVPGRVFRTRGGNAFVFQPNGTVIETRPNGSRSTFRIHGVGPDYVELFDSDRKMFVRLTSNQGLFLAPNGQWSSWGDSVGTWSSQSFADAAVNLTGQWRDLSHQSIQIQHNGNFVQAHAPGYSAWTYAEGQIDGDTIRMRHFNANNQQINVVTGFIRGGRIDWANQTAWSRQ